MPASTVRRYGLTGPLFAEQKTKRGQEVRKRRSPVPDGLVAPFMAVTPCEGWACEWFRTETAARNLRPVCRVSYDRVAYMGKAADGGAVRVTFDRNVLGALAHGWDAVPVVGPELLPRHVICEFRVAMPVMFKAIIEALAPATVSKYRLFMSTARVPTTELRDSFEERRCVLATCLQKFPAEQHDLLARRYEPTGSANALAEAVGTTPKAVSDRLRRIRHTLLQMVRIRSLVGFREAGDSK